MISALSISSSEVSTDPFSHLHLVLQKRQEIDFRDWLKSREELEKRKVGLKIIVFVSENEDVI